jgi:hypothetical protein
VGFSTVVALLFLLLTPRPWYLVPDDLDGSPCATGVPAARAIPLSIPIFIQLTLFNLILLKAQVLPFPSMLIKQQISAQV